MKDTGERTTEFNCDEDVAKEGQTGWPITGSVTLQSSGLIRGVVKNGLFKVPDLGATELEVGAGVAIGLIGATLDDVGAGVMLIG